MTCATKPAWRVAAELAAQQRFEQHEREQKRRDDEQRVYRRDELARALKDRLGIDVPLDAISVTEGGYYGFRAIVELDGVTFAVNHNYDLVATVPCADCDGVLSSARLFYLEDLGFFLLNPQGSWHEHWFSEGSTHPNAPQPKAPFDSSAPERMPTIAEQLEDFIRRVVRSELSNMEAFS